MNPAVYAIEEQISESCTRIRTYSNNIKDVTYKFDVLKNLDLISNEIADIKRMYAEIEEVEYSEED